MRLFGIRIAKASTIEREISTAVDEFFLIRAGWYFPTLTSCIEVSPYMNTVGAFWKLAEGNHGIISGQNARVN